MIGDFNDIYDKTISKIRDIKITKVDQLLTEYSKYILEQENKKTMDMIKLK